MTFRYVGKSLERNDAHAKVTGEAKFLADLKFPRTLHLQVLRAAHAHALVKSVDTAEAKAMDGVRAVLTGADCPTLYGACLFKDVTALAVDRVRQAGEGVAAVVADTLRQAKAAVAKVKVEYEPLPVLIDPKEAAEDTKNLIHPKLGEYFHLPGYLPVPGTNIQHHYKLRKGDIEKGRAGAEVTVEGTFDYPLAAHSAMEPHGCVARWEGHDRVEIWATTQAPFVLQEVIAGIYGIPQAHVRVHVAYLGGGFGGKSDVTVEPMVVAAARLVPGRHVRYICTRKEVMTSTVLGRGMKGWGRLGAMRDGTFAFFEAKMWFQGGSSGDTECNVVTVAGHNSVGPYSVDHCHVDAMCVYTNTPPTGAYRGYGHPEGTFISERLIDLLARKLDMDPLDLRRRNFLGEGKKNSLGETIRAYNGNLHECLARVEKDLYAGGKPANDADYLYGRGVAAMMKSPKGAAHASSSCQIKFCHDGSLLVNLSGIDMGQGAQQAMRQIAAEALKVDPARVSVYREVDTQHSPWEWQTVASMFTYRGGNAVCKTAEKLISILKENAAIVLKVSVDSLDYDGDFVFDRTDPDHRIAVPALVRGFMGEHGLTVGTVAEATAADRLPYYMEPDPETGMGHAGGTWTYGAQGAEVRVCRRTGKIDILHFVTALDVGRVISPVMIRGQIVGGVMMGIGHALMEKVEFDADGKMKNSMWNKYRLPRLADMPLRQTVHCVETPEVRGPFGARCVAEHPIVAAVPAILNALRDATGHDFWHIPVVPADVLSAIGEAK